MSIPTHREEFPPEFAVPREIALHPELQDISWHNDICPSFIVRTEADLDEGELIRLWVNPADPDQREYSDEPRFNVSTADGDVLFESETDWQGAIDVLLTAARERQATSAE